MATISEISRSHFVEPEFDPFLDAMAEFEQAARELDLEPWIFERLKHPAREVALSLSYSLPGCAHALVTGFRILHSSARGPGLGPLYVDPTMSLSQLRASALKTTWQCALLDLPFGGSSGALLCDAGLLSEAELRTIVQAYIERLGGMIGRLDDIVVPHRGCNRKLAAWMMESCGRQGGVSDFAAVTGKPSALWGISSQDIAAQALLALLAEMLSARAAKLQGQRVIVQGFGTSGAAIARALYNSGVLIVGLADISGALYQERGINLPQAQTYFQQHRILYGYPNADPVANADLLEAPADMLILAAAPNQVTVANAEHIRAQLVIEVAENAISAEGSAVLRDRGILVLPELLAGSGPLVAAFLEWMQGIRFCRLSAEEIPQAIKARMAAVWRDLRHSAGQDLRRKAVQLGVSRVAETLRALA